MGVQDLDTQKFLDALQAHPIGKEIKNTAQAETIAARKKLIEALAANEAKADKAFPLLAKAVDTAVAKVRAAEKALQAANEDLWKANQAKSNASFDHTGERHRIEALLSDTEYYETITEFQREMRNGQDDARKQFDFHNEVIVNALTGATTHRGYDNRASVDARISAMRAAIDQAEALRLIADQSNVPERLAAIRSSLPKVSRAVDPTEKRA